MAMDTFIYWTFILYLMIMTPVHSNNDIIRIFLSGDVMLGRAIDQILRYPLNPRIPTMKGRPKRNATHYVEIAETVNGKIPSYEITSQNYYIWGDMIESFNYYTPHVKLLNIETSITTSDHSWKNKGIWYRMNPKNIYVLNEINKDANLVCTFANNHVLDWGYQGLNETIETLTNNNILFCGVGQNFDEAWKPSVIEVKNKNCRVFIFGVGTVSSFIYKAMAATTEKSGIAMVNPYNSSKHYIEYIMQKIKKYVLKYIEGKEEQKNINNIVILSIHWDVNWNWNVSNDFKRFAHALIDYNDNNDNNNNNNIAIDMIHGHSSHHIKAFEIYKNKAIFYGCGDTIDDYEGITRYAPYMHDLSFLYFVDLNVLTGNVNNIILKGTQTKHFQITYAKNKSLTRLYDKMKKLCKEFNVSLYQNDSDETLRFSNDIITNHKLKEDINIKDKSMGKIVNFTPSHLYCLIIVYVPLLVYVLKRNHGF